MGLDGVNYTIGNVKAAFGSVSRDTSQLISICTEIFSLQFAHGGAVNWAASIGVK